MDINNIKWMQHPEQYYPEPKTLVNCMKWHIALMKRISERHRVINPRQDEDIPKLKDMADIKSDNESRMMQDRDRAFFEGLGYTNVAFIETAILIGRDLWYRNRNGSAACVEDKTLDEVDIRDLKQWADIYDVPLTIQDGGNIRAAYEYAFIKNRDFLQCYIDRLERDSKERLKKVV